MTWVRRELASSVSCKVPNEIIDESLNMLKYVQSEERRGVYLRRLRWVSDA